MAPILILILAIILAIIVSSLPLYFAVGFLGGRATILKVFSVNIIVAILTAVLVNMIGLGGLFIFAITIVLYAIMFEMGIIRALLAWLIQFVVAAILLFLALLFIPALAAFL